MAKRKILTPEFMSVFLSQFALSFTANLLIPTLPIYLAGLGSREKTIGILIGAMSVSSLILRPLVGKALMRVPERKFLLAGALIYVVTSLSYIVAPPFWPFLMVRIFQGIGAAFFYTASVIMVINISPQAHRTESISYFYTAYNFASAIAPTVGMYIINLINFRSLFLLSAALSLLSLILALRLPKKPTQPPGNEPAQNGLFWDLETLHPAVNILWGALAAFFPLYAVSQGVANPGFFFGACALTLIVGRMLGGRILDRYSRERVILPCLIAFIASMTLLSFSKTLPLFILVAIIYGTGLAFFFPTLVVYTVERAGAARGPAMGTFTAAGDLGVGLGAVIMGIVLQSTSYRTMFLCLALIAIINLGYFHYFMRDRNKSPQVACSSL
jgi:predicted MFS family arabinose efflux permease